jgi:septum formation protein
VTRLVLASSSPARAKMLRDAGLDIEVRPSPLDETAAKRELGGAALTPPGVAQRLAVAKALAVDARPEEWILGADQTLDLEGALLDKPCDLTALKTQLERLRGREHRLHAAAALVRGGCVMWEGCSPVRVVMRPLADEEIARYIEAEGSNVAGCVGGYRLEGPGVRLLEAVEGEYFSVLGLPLLGLLEAMRGLGIEP